MIPDVFMYRRVREHLLDYLKVDIPRRIEQAERAAGYTDLTAPPWLPHGIAVPVDWDNYDPLDVTNGNYPSVGVYVNGASSHRRVDLETGGGSEIKSTWQIIVSIACTNRYLGLDEDGVDDWESPERVAAINNCQDLTSIVKQSLLNSPNFNADIRSSDSFVELVDNTLAIQFSDPMRPNDSRSPRWVAVSQISFQVSVTEQIKRPILGVVRTTHIRTEVLPR